MHESEVVALMVTFIVLGFVATVLILSRYFSRRLRSREIIKALEAGQPLPEPPRRQRSFVSDLRIGVLLIAFGIGFGLFLWMVRAGDATSMIFIPLLLGAGFLVNAALVRRVGDREDAGPPV